ncbi:MULTISPECIES: RNA-directed DNA polymerase [Cyanophyceae]|uniref:RNA-directed DNA polymerase n=1 Tax=Cyanophyceae TaxID=3028117 RepID=UPI0016883155|nr:RNA-directed DNA polymerase [Trichocoleus sp. FACHB-69]MBD1930472.1 RNA-directed DNA polymerase [Trichocoleus sp. FACHB-69]
MTQLNPSTEKDFLELEENSQPAPTIQDFIKKGFFPKELVPAFTTESLAQNLPSFKEILGSKNNLASKCFYYSFPKVKHLRRNLGIPNPFHQINLSQTLIDNWIEIQKTISICDLSISAPLTNSINRAVSPPPVQLSNERAIQAAGSRYRLYTDISRYYSTIYTHSIPWAIHGKAQCKANLKLKKNQRTTFYGDLIDECVRNTQDKQSIGIPIGPDSSFVIAEIIGTIMDKMLCDRLGDKPRGFRFIDDYYLYFDTFSDAEQALYQLHKILKEFELETNSSKTSIIELPEPLESAWVSEIRRYNISPDGKEQNTEIISFFSKVFEYSKLFTDEQVIKYSLSRIRNQKNPISPDNWSLFESLILQSIIAEPSALETGTEILVSYYENDNFELDKSRIADTITSLIINDSKLSHSHELAWALWLSKTLKIAIKEEAAQKISEIEDSVVALVTLDLREQGLIPRGLDLTRWESLMTTDELYSTNWLLAYEANIKGWLPSQGKSDHVDKDAFFKSLKSHNVSFYDSIQQANLVDDDQTGYDNDDETEAYYWMY